MIPCVVTVPATTANLGPGFDCLGAALSLYNVFNFLPQAPGAPAFTLTLLNGDLPALSNDPDNLLYRAFCRLYETLGKAPPAVKIEARVGVPLARGLGSSATAIVGGLVGANTLAGNPLTVEEILKLAIELEGHPDNVAPALLGGAQLSVSGEDGLTIPLEWHPDLIPVVIIPDFELSTAQARAVLPPTYSRGDAVFNAARLGLLTQALAQGRGDWLAPAMEDKIHQPYRQTLIPGYAELKAMALAAGAYNLVISGAGPTLLALTSSEKAPVVIRCLESVWRDHGVQAKGLALSLDEDGARIRTVIS